MAIHSKRWWPGVPRQLFWASQQLLITLSPLSLELWLTFGVSQTPSFHPAPHLAALPAPLTHQSLLLLGNAASPQSLGLFLKDLCSCWRHRRAQKLGGFGAPGRAGFNCPCSSTSPSTCPRQPKPQKLDAPCEEHNVHLVLAAKDLKDDFWDQGSL